MQSTWSPFIMYLHRILNIPTVEMPVAPMLNIPFIIFLATIVTNCILLTAYDVIFRTQRMGLSRAFEIMGLPVGTRRTFYQLFIKVMLNPRDFDYIPLLQPPHCFKKFALLFSAEFEVPHHLSHGGLSIPTSLKPTLQVLHDQPLDPSALPRCVSDENCDCPKHLLGF